MAEGVKTMFRIAKKLEESFKLISFYSSRYLIKSSKYRADYLDEYKKLTGRIKNESKKERIRDKQKFKEQRDKMKRQMLRIKEQKHQQKQRDRQKNNDGTSDKRRESVRDKSDNKDRRRDSEYEKSRPRDHERSQNRDHGDRDNRDRDNHRNRDNDRNNHRNRDNDRDKRNDDIDRHSISQKGRRTQKDQQYMPKQRDRERDRENRMRSTRDYPDLQSQKKNDKYHSDSRDKLREKISQKPNNYFPEDDAIQGVRPGKKDKYDIFGSFGPNQVIPQNQRVKKAAAKWSQTQYQYLGSLYPDKYKILKVDQEESDFEAEDAPVKVPFIKPRQPLTPYFLFLREKRYIINQSYPHLKQNQMSTTLCTVWKNLPASDKQPYIEENERALKIYHKKLDQYYETNPENKYARKNELNQIEEAARASCARRGKKDKKPKEDKKQDKKQPKKRQTKAKKT